MRAHLVHPWLPNGGREITKLFSPSRKGISEKGADKVCVVCLYDDSKNTKKKKMMIDPAANSTLEEGKHDYSDDDDIGVDGDASHVDSSTKKEAFVPLLSCLCIDFKGTGIRKHYAHKTCAKMLAEKHERKKTPVCPRCLDLQQRAAPPFDGAEMWCSDIVPYLEGFPVSPKLKAVVEYALALPTEDKIIILSFFKGGLDLIEAALCHIHKWKCARFDGDISSERKLAELSKFKKEEDCRAILMTVQSGGVGLNLTEANHVIFLDRWLNPFVHDQAEDRAHRLGQEKDVHITYVDVAATLDEGLYQINRCKKDNATLLLKDNLVQLDRDCQMAQMSYKELRGLIGKEVKALNDHRKAFASMGDDYEIPKLSSSIGEN